MSDMVSYCGIDCGTCPAYLATQANDDAKRTKVANLWSRMFGTAITKEGINCDGCRQNNGRLFGHCRTCNVRLCAQGKDLDSCGRCRDYSCETLNDLLALLPIEEPRKNLEAIREGR